MAEESKRAREGMSPWAPWLPGCVAWRVGQPKLAMVHVLAVLLCLFTAVACTPRLLRLWNPASTEILAAALLLYLLPALVFLAVRLDARRLEQIRGRAVVRRNPWDRLLQNRTAAAGGFLVLALGIVAVLAPVLAPSSPQEFVDISRTAFQPPGTQFLLGSDQFGRDILTRLLYGARVSLAVGFLAVALAISIGTLVGLVAGYTGRWVDSSLMRFIDLLIAFPRLFLVLLLIGLTETSIWLVITVLALTGWMQTARLVRAQVLSLREMDFVMAARALGLPPWRILARHILPNTMAPVIVSATLMVGNTILAESVLSFLGLGVQIPTPSWGSMVDEGRRVFPDVWWLATFPGIAITLTVVGFNLLGDGLRDAFDPRISL